MGVSNENTKCSINVWIVNVISGKAKMICQYSYPLGSPYIFESKNDKKQLTKIPIVMKSCWNVPKKPESSNGAVYFIKSGIIALNRPAHIPWQNLKIMYVFKSAKNIRIPIVKAA